jgi:O-antigen ligase
VLFRLKHKRPLTVVGVAVGFLLLFFMIFSTEGGLNLRTYGAGTHGIERLTDFSHYLDSFMLRIENWSYGVSVFTDNLFFGHGFYPYYKLCPTWQTTKLAHPHSVILNLLITSGMVGTVMFILFFWMALRRIWPCCFGHGRASGFQRTVLLCLLCMLLNGMVNGIFIWTPIPSLFFCFLALLMAMERNLAEARERELRVTEEEVPIPYACPHSPV